MDFQAFSDHFSKLKSAFPVYPSHNLRCENTDYGDYLASCENAYYSFDCAECKNITFVYDSFKAVNCCDCDYIVESENCYECVDTVKAYNSTYLDFCGRIYDSHFCYNCHDCDHIFGCSNLKYQKFCIFNRKYSENDYASEVKKLMEQDPENILQKMEETNRKFPVTVSHVNNSENSDYGNQVFFGRNLYLCFDCAHSEDSAYLYDAHHNKHCYDLTQCFHCEFSYECVDCARLSRCFHMSNCEDVFDSGFCERCSNSNHLLGCVGIDKKEYCILNRQYTSEEYVRIYEEIMGSYKRHNQTNGSGNSSTS